MKFTLESDDQGIFDLYYHGPEYREVLRDIYYHYRNKVKHSDETGSWEEAFDYLNNALYDSDIDIT